MTLTATIEVARPDALLTWRGHVLASWFFEGYRRFEIEPVAPTPGQPYLAFDTT